MAKRPQKKPPIAEALALVAEHAPKLRTAGVTALTMNPDGSFSASFAPAPDQPAAPAPKKATEVPRPHYPNPLDDPDSYPGGRVPGFTMDQERPKSS